MHGPEDMSVTESEIRDLLIEIKVKVDMLVSQHNDHESRLRAVEARPVPDTSKDTDVETRLRALERMRWIIVGGSMVVGGVAGKIAGLL